MTTFYCLRFEPGGPGPCIYMPQEQGGPVIPPDTGFAFRHLLRLTGLLWEYSAPPQRRVLTNSVNWQLGCPLCPLCTNRVENTSIFGASNRCRRNVYTDPLPRNGLHNTVGYSAISQQRLCTPQYRMWMFRRISRFWRNHYIRLEAHTK
jgi:hypothetical protein